MPIEPGRRRWHTGFARRKKMKTTNIMETKTYTTYQTEAISCTDADLDALASDSLARILRDGQRDGVFVSDGEIAGAYVRETLG
jgi:hypothetical protein